MCDRAGYLTNYGGFNQNAGFGRMGSSRLLKKVLQYTETYLDNFDNFGFGGNACGFGGNAFGYNGGFDSCPVLGAGLGPGIDMMKSFGMVGPFDKFGKDYKKDIDHEKDRGFNRHIERDNWNKRNRRDRRDDDEEESCNPFCKPCHVPECNIPRDTSCQCELCTDFSRQIFA